MIKTLIRHVVRNGVVFKKFSRQLSETERLSEGELTEYRDEKLRHTVKTAYDNVPFYRRAFDERKLKPADIRTAGDLAKLPLIDKQTVRLHFRDFRNRSFRGAFFKAHTGGTTGTPGIFLRDGRSMAFENAQLWRQYRWAGKAPGSRRVTLRGDLLFKSSKTMPPFWKENPFDRELLISSYHLSEKTFAACAGEIKAFGAYDLYAYPSTAQQLARLNAEKGAGLRFERVFTSSETLSERQRGDIEAAFGARVFDWYGSAERVAAIGHCERGAYHEISDYSLVEYLPAEGGVEPVGTTFENSVMPLIRYRLGDLVEPEGGACACGRAFPRIRRIHGRQAKALRTPEGRRVTIVNHIPWGVEGLIEMQYVQKSSDRITVRVVAGPKFTDSSRSALLGRLKDHISPAIRYEIEAVDSIPRTASGKFEEVIQEMPS